VARFNLILTKIAEPFSGYLAPIKKARNEQNCGKPGRNDWQVVEQK